MDLDMELGGDEETSPEPIYHSILNAMGTKKEATADQIYKRIQQDGAANYSKPQVDRALANALQYGIFEVRNNRYRLRDDVLDDEDTIYCQAHIKREKTPYRLENNQRDYINPEKDQHTFRKLNVSDGEGYTSCKKQTVSMEVTKGRKGRVYNQKIVNAAIRSNKCRKNSEDQQVNKTKESEDKTKTVTTMKRQSISNKRVPAKRVAKTGGQKDVKKRRKETSYDIPDSKYGNPHSHYSQASDSETSSKPAKQRKKTGRKNVKDEDEEDEDEEDEDEEEEEEDDDEEEEDNDEDEEDEEDEDEDEDEEEVAFDKTNGRKKPSHSSDGTHLKEPNASKYSKRKGRSNYLCNHDFHHSSNGTDITAFPNEKNFENKNWSPKITCSKSVLGRSENLQVEEWSSKAGWLVNRPQNTQDGTVKQFDNALKIEPLDSFQNMEEPSYIS